MRVGELLAQQGLVGPAEIEAALAAKRVAPKARLGDILVGMGCVTRDQVDGLVTAQSGEALIDIRAYTANPAAILLLPAPAAAMHECVALDMVEGQLLIAFRTNPSADQLAAVRFAVGKPVVGFGVDDPQLLQTLLSRHYADPSKTVVRHASVDEEAYRKMSAGEGTAAGIFRRLAAQAIASDASDMHFRPCANGSLKVLFRIDGTLREVRSIEQSTVSAVVRHIELFAGIDPFSHSAPKEGRCCLQYDGRQVDLRVSVIEGAYGDSLVLRVLDPARFPESLTQLKLSPEQVQGLQVILQRPHGLLVATGPTGSGKTTTLYTMLREFLKLGHHVCTAEDPVEFRIDGINQFETSDFAALLPRLLRHDPDVVMVGELRDAKTVEMAINAALTGHLVLSTVHANDSASTIHRLMGLGAPLHLLSSSLTGIMSQRLVRLTCTSCAGAGCSECGNSGYLGRTLAAELARPRPSLVRLQGMPTHAELQDQLDFVGGCSLNDIIVDLAAQGRTTWQEAASIVTDPSVLPYSSRTGSTPKPTR